MAQIVYKPSEVNNKKGSVLLRLAKDDGAEDDAAEDGAGYAEPETEGVAALASARAEADKLLGAAEKAAKEMREEAASCLAKAQEDAAGIISAAKVESEKIRAGAERKRRSALDKAREEGFNRGKEEAERLAEQLRAISGALQSAREEILDGTERQLVTLAILIARKVVKTLSTTQESVIEGNVLSALRKVKQGAAPAENAGGERRAAGCDVVLRVNTADAAFAKEHAAYFGDLVKSISGITVVEDRAVDKGGCVVETGFGSIDATIKGQLEALESQLLSIAPPHAD